MFCAIFNFQTRSSSYRIENGVIDEGVDFSNTKLAYFVQGFETWVADEETVYKTYKFPMKKIVVSKWLENIVIRYCDDKVSYVPNGINLSVFNLKVPIKERKPHTIIFHYRTMECKGSSCIIQV